MVTVTTFLCSGLNLCFERLRKITYVKWRDLMKAIAYFMLIHGVSIGLDAYIKLSTKAKFIFGSVVFDANLHLVSFVVSAWLIVSAIGLLMKSRYSYYSTIIIYFLFAIYVLFSVVYLSIFEGFKLVPITILISFFLLFCFILKYLFQNKRSIIH